jgi:hypothetical protein
MLLQRQLVSGATAESSVICYPWSTNTRILLPEKITVYWPASPCLRSKASQVQNKGHAKSQFKVYFRNAVGSHPGSSQSHLLLRDREELQAGLRSYHIRLRRLTLLITLLVIGAKVQSNSYCRTVS